MIPWELLQVDIYDHLYISLDDFVGMRGEERSSVFTGCLARIDSLRQLEIWELDFRTFGTHCIALLYNADKQSKWLHLNYPTARHLKD